MFEMETVNALTVCLELSVPYVWWIMEKSLNVTVSTVCFLNNSYQLMNIFDGSSTRCICCCIFCQDTIKGRDQAWSCTHNRKPWEGFGMGRVEGCKFEVNLGHPNKAKPQLANVQRSLRDLSFLSTAASGGTGFSKSGPHLCRWLTHKKTNLVPGPKCFWSLRNSPCTKYHWFFILDLFVPLAWTKVKEETPRKAVCPWVWSWSL